jgi:hypothetical protein
MVAEEFARFVTEKLRPHAAPLLNQLRQLIGHHYPPQVAALEFEVFADGFTSGFPIRTYFVDSDRTEFFLDTDSGPAYPSPIDPGLLKIPHVYLEAEEARFLEREPGLDTYTVAAETLIPWFADLWRRAGGSAFPIHADIGIHDDTVRLDLRSNEWLAA